MSDLKSMQYVIDTLTQEGYIENAEAVILPEQRADTWYIRGLLGCGGWIASVFFFLMGGFFIAIFFDSFDESVFGLSAIVMGIGMLTFSLMASKSADKNVFVEQVMLAIHIAGQLLLYIGIGFLAVDNTTYDNGDAVATIIAIVVILTNSLMIFFYNNNLFHFLATLAIIAAANGLIYLWNVPAGLSFLIILLTIGNLIIWGNMLSVRTQINRYALLQNMGYGLTIGLGFTIIYQIVNGYNEFEAASGNLHTPIITSLMLLVLVIYLEIRLFDEYTVHRNSKTALTLLAFTVIITLPTLITPGILAGIFVLLLGFRKRNRILIALSMAFLAGFVSEFYYSLEFTLLVKSFILIGTGVLFLIGRVLLQRVIPTPPQEASV